MKPSRLDFDGFHAALNNIAHVVQLQNARVAQPGVRPVGQTQRWSETWPDLQPNDQWRFSEKDSQLLWQHMHNNHVPTDGVADSMDDDCRNDRSRRSSGGSGARAAGERVKVTMPVDQIARVMMSLISSNFPLDSTDMYANGITGYAVRG
jgi:hypothetical protein